MGFHISHMFPHAPKSFQYVHVFLIYSLGPQGCLPVRIHPSPQDLRQLADPEPRWPHMQRTLSEAFFLGGNTQKSLGRCRKLTVRWHHCPSCFHMSRSGFSGLAFAADFCTLNHALQVPTLSRFTLQRSTATYGKLDWFRNPFNLQ